MSVCNVLISKTTNSGLKFQLFEGQFHGIFSSRTNNPIHPNTIQNISIIVDLYFFLPSCLLPVCKNEFSCETIHMRKMCSAYSFRHFPINQLFHKKGFSRRLVFKQRHKTLRHNKGLSRKRKRVNPLYRSSN